MSTTSTIHFCPPLLTVLVNEKLQNKMLWIFSLRGEILSKPSSEEEGLHVF